MPEQQQPRPAATFPPIPVPQETGPAQSNLFAPAPPPPTHVGPKAVVPLKVSDHDDRPPQRIPYWLQQSERFLRVIVRIYIGLVVCLVPWYAPFWDSNPLFTHFPWLTAIITQGAVRGLVSGLGLLNLWVALRDLIRGSAEAGSH